MAKTTRSIVASIGLALGVAACGGSGSMPIVAESPAPSTPVVQYGNAVFVVTIPLASVAASGAKRPAYLTAQVRGIDFSVRANDGTGPNDRGYVFYAVDPQSPYCAAAAVTLTCRLPVQAYPGNDLFSVRTYDQSNPSTPGSPDGGTSHIISTGSVAATIGPNASSTISIVTSGVVSKLLVGLDTPLPPTGTPITQPVHVAAFDADYNLIVGNFDHPVSLTDDDTTGATALSQNSIASSADAPTLSYTGGALASATITVTTASPSDSLNGGPFHANISLIPGGTGIWTSPSYLAFPGAFAASQVLRFNNTTSAFQSVSGCSAFATVNGGPPPSPPPTYAVQPLHTGACDLRFNYANGTSVTVPIVIGPN